MWLCVCVCAIQGRCGRPLSVGECEEVYLHFVSSQRYLFVTVGNGFEVYDVIGQEGEVPCDPHSHSFCPHTSSTGHDYPHLFHWS